MAVRCRAEVQKQPLERAPACCRLAFETMNAQAFRRFEWRRPRVKLLTMHSAKCLEFPRLGTRRSCGRCANR